MKISVLENGNLKIIINPQLKGTLSATGKSRIVDSTKGFEKLSLYGLKGYSLQLMLVKVLPQKPLIKKKSRRANNAD